MMATSNVEPYVGPRPFQRVDEAFFFGRDKEASELLSLIIANPVLLIYARSGAGKTSLINARLIPQLEDEGIETLPIARVQGRIPADINLSRTPGANAYVFNALMSWKREDDDPRELAKMTLAEFLARDRPTPGSDDDQVHPRVVVFDQFEELFTFYPDRWTDRLEFFRQVSDLLDGSPLLLRTGDLLDPASLWKDFAGGDDTPAGALWQLLSAETQESIRRGGEESAAPASLKLLVDDLNRIVQSESVVDERIYAHAELRDETRRLLKQQPSAREIPKLNRLILEDAFPLRIRRRVEGDPLLRVVFSMREDYIAELDPYASVLPNKLRARYRLEPLRRMAALSAVEGPLQQTSLRFQPGVAAHLVENLLKIPVKTAAGAEEIPGEFIEPVQLQVVCQSLWDNVRVAGQSEITDEHLRVHGNVSKALRAFYEKTIQKVMQAKGVKEWVLRRWFEEVLITTAGTRGMVFRGAKTTGGLDNDVVDELESQHIIRAELRGGERWYELSHDRFIQPIGESNNDWRLARSGAVAKRNELQEKTQAWVLAGRGEQGLLDESAAIEAARWLRSPDAVEVGYSEDLFAFVQSSRLAVAKAANDRERALFEREKMQAEAIAEEQRQRAEAERERREEHERRAEAERERAEEKARSTARLRKLVAGLAVMIVFTIGAAVYAMSQQYRAGISAAEADEQARLAQAAAELARTNESRAEQAAREAKESEKQAHEAREKSVKESERARRNEEEAKQQREIARQQQQRALVESKRATEQANLARANERKAMKEKEDADTARAAAKAAQAEAEAQAQEAGKAREDSEVEKEKFKAQIPALELERDNALARVAAVEEQNQACQVALKNLGVTDPPNTPKDSEAYYNEGLQLEAKGEPGKAIESYLRARNGFREQKNLGRDADITSRLADLYSYSVAEDYSKASENYTALLALYQTLGDKAGVAATLRRTGDFFRSKYGVTNNPEDARLAVESLNKALALYQSANSAEGQAATHDAIGDVYLEEKKFALAIESYSKAESIYDESNNEKGEAQMLFMLGYAHQLKGNYNVAEEYYKKSLEKRRVIDDLVGQIAAANNLGDLYQLLGDSKRASEYFRLAQQIQSRISPKQQRR